MNFTLKYLKYFVCAAKHKNFSKASEELFISKSSVINAIDKLESELGFSLFIRQKSKGLSLTSEGRQLFLRSKHLLDEIKHFGDDMESLGSSVTGTLTIGFYESYSPFFMGNILNRLKENYPKLQLLIVEGGVDKLIDLAIEGEIDVFFSPENPQRPPPESICFEVLKTFYPFVLMPAGHSLSSQAEVSLHELAKLPMVLPNFGAIGSVYTSYFEAVGLQSNVVLRLGSYESVRCCVASGIGFSLSHIHPLCEAPYNGEKLVYKPLKEKIGKANLLAGYVKPATGKPTKKVTAFIDECRAIMQSEWASSFFTENPPRD